MASFPAATPTLQNERSPQYPQEPRLPYAQVAGNYWLNQPLHAHITSAHGSTTFSPKWLPHIHPAHPMPAFTPISLAPPPLPVGNNRNTTSMLSGYLKAVKPLLSPFLKPVTYMINELSLSRNHTILTIVTIITNNGNYVTKLATQANAKRLTQLYRRSASRAKPTRPCSNLSLTQRLRLHHLHTLNIPNVEPTRRPCSNPSRRLTAEHSSRRQSQAYRYPQPSSQNTYQASLIVHQPYA